MNFLIEEKQKSFFSFFLVPYFLFLSFCQLFWFVSLIYSISPLVQRIFHHSMLSQDFFFLTFIFQLSSKWVFYIICVLWNIFCLVIFCGQFILSPFYLIISFINVLFLVTFFQFLFLVKFYSCDNFVYASPAFRVFLFFISGVYFCYYTLYLVLGILFCFSNCFSHIFLFFWSCGSCFQDFIYFHTFFLTQCILQIAF